MLRVLFLSIAAFSALAQKAEPVRLDAGASVRGWIRNAQMAEYELHGTGGTELEIRLRSSPLNSVELRALGTNASEIALYKTDGDRWKVKFSRSGEYVVAVRRKSAKRGRSTYSLTVGRP